MLISNYFLLPVFCVAAIEIFVRTKALNFIGNMQAKFASFFKIVSSSNVSDHWKERVIPKYALIIIINALKFLAVLGLIVVVFIGFHLLFEEFFQFSISVIGMTEMLVFSALYIKMRPKLTREAESE